MGHFHQIVDQPRRFLTATATSGDASASASAGYATAASAASGFRVLSRIRGQSWKCGMGWIYFEWTFGSVNSEIAVEDIELGWSAFLKALKEV